MSDNNEITLDCDLPRIDSTKRKAAEEWAVDEWGWLDKEDDHIRKFLADGHFAGQECGEQRAVEGIVRWLRGVKVNGIVCAHLNEFAAEMIERGEWKEGIK